MEAFPLTGEIPVFQSPLKEDTNNMEYIYSAMLLHKAGKKISTAAITKILEAAGVKPDEGRLKALVATLKDIKIEEAIKAVPVAAPAAAPAAKLRNPSRRKKRNLRKKRKKKNQRKSRDSVHSLARSHSKAI